MGAETGNAILDLLPAAARRQFHRMLVQVQSGAELFGVRARITHGFFPTTAVCSISVELASGDKAETALVGRDGFVGVPLVLGVPMSYTRAVIQVPGEGYRIGAKPLLELTRQYDAFRRALLGYSAFRLQLASRSVACNSFHSIRQRLARWLLLAHDRARSSDFRLTHEALSAMLAATRPRVSQAAAQLRAEGMIDYVRGAVRILDRKQLETAACDCYEENKLALATYAAR